MLFMQEPKYKRGSKFDHVWNIVKNFEKFKDNVPIAKQAARKQSQHENVNLSKSDSHILESPILASPRLSSSPPTLNDDNVGGISSERPIGVKKSKLKRKNDEEMSYIINSFEEGNEQIKIIQKRNQQEGSSSAFGNYFDDIGGSGSDLLEY